MSDKEFFALRRITLSNYGAFILFPAVCFLLVIFGYIVPAIVVIEAALLCIILANFVPRTIFFATNPKFIAKGRFLFETISYISCLVFAILTAFLVKKNGNEITYYFLNIYIQPAFIIYTFVVLGYMASTAKRISKIYIDEQKNRKD